MLTDQDNKEPNTPLELLIEETRLAMENTQEFLDHLAESDEVSRQHLRQFVESLQQRLEELRSH